MIERIVTATALAAAVFSAAASGLERYSLTVNEFSRLKVVDAINVDYRSNPDSAGVVVFTSLPDAASVIGMSNRNGELTIGFTSADTRRPESLPTVTVYSSYLTHVENSGDSTVRVLATAPVTDFSAKLIGNGRIVVRDIDAGRVSAKIATGNGQIVVYGRCNEASLGMMGAGVIQANDLRAQEVKCSAFGTGSIGCLPLKTLKVHGMGSTTVYYRGHPEIRNRALFVKIEALPQ